MTGVVAVTGVVVVIDARALPGPLTIGGYQGLGAAAAAAAFPGCPVAGVRVAVTTTPSGTEAPDHPPITVLPSSHRYHRGADKAVSQVLVRELNSLSARGAPAVGVVLLSGDPEIAPAVSRTAAATDLREVTLSSSATRTTLVTSPTAGRSAA